MHRACPTHGPKNLAMESIYLAMESIYESFPKLQAKYDCRVDF